MKNYMGPNLTALQTSILRNAGEAPSIHVNAENPILAFRLEPDRAECTVQAHGNEK